MPTKGFILVIRATLAIGATMTILEIMPTMASPLAVELEVDELEWTMQTNIFLSTVVATCSMIRGVLVVLGIRDQWAAPLAVYQIVEEVDRTIY